MRMKRTLPNPPGAGGPRARSRWLRAALLQTLLAALCAGAGLARPAGAQDVLDHHVTLTLEAQPMKKVLSQLERLAAVSRLFEQLMYVNEAGKLFILVNKLYEQSITGKVEGNDEISVN